MRLYKTYIISLLFLLINFFGCIDDLVAPDNNVNGTLYTNEGLEYRLPIYYNHVLIKAGDYPILYLENPPYFNISVTSKPYDLNILFPFDSSYQNEPSTYKYIGLNSSTPKIVDANYITDEESFNKINFAVYFPPVQERKVAYFKFLSKDFFIQWYSSSSVSPNVQYIVSPIYVNKNCNSISGRIIFMVASYDSSGITSFDNFGFRDTTFDYNHSNIIVFNENDISYNPRDIESASTVTFPQNCYPKTISMMLEFDGFNSSSELSLYDTRNFSDILIYPELPVEDIKYKLHSTYETYYNVPFNKPAENWKYFEPGTNVELQHYNLVQIYSPPDNSTVDSSSVFEISDNLPAGIYTYDICRTGSDYKCLRIITTKKKFLLSDFLMEGFEYIPGQRYIWNVKKHIGYSNMDEFVSKIYTIDKVPSALSKGRAFILKDN